MTKTSEALTKWEILNSMPVLTIPEAARYMRGSNKNIYALVEMGRIKTVNYGTPMIYKSEIDRFYRENRGNDFKKEIDEFLFNKKIQNSKSSEKVISI